MVLVRDAELQVWESLPPLSPGEYWEPLHQAMADGGHTAFSSPFLVSFLRHSVWEKALDYERTRLETFSTIY